MSNEDLGVGYELVGLTCFGPPPLGEVHLRLQAGVLALYGRNGAGKTRVLRAANAALTGVAQAGGTALLHLRLTTPNSSLSSAPRGTASERLGTHLAEKVQAWRNETLFSELADAVEDDYLNDLIWEHADWFVQGRDATLTDLVRELFDLAAQEVEEPSEFVPLIDEVVPQALLTLEAVGDRTPCWRAWVSATISEDTPLLARAYQKTLSSSEWMMDLMRRMVRADDGSMHLPFESIDDFTAEFKRHEAPPTPYRPVEAEAKGGFIPATPPPWVPLRLLAVGDLSEATFSPPVVVAEDENLTAVIMSRRAIENVLTMPGGSMRPLITAVDDEDVAFDTSVEDFLVEVSARASELSATIVPDAPVLRCDLAHPNKWLHEPPLRWNAYDPASMQWVGIDDLSDAHRRWATVAIRIALAEREGKGRTMAVLLDEPERALHPGAVQDMVQGLLRSAGSYTIVVATHSPHFLNHPSVFLHHVERGDTGKTSVRPVPEGTVTELGHEALGLTRADMLQHYRVFVAVEGEHDKAVLDGLLGDDLAAAHARVVVMRGAHALKQGVDVQLLFEFTDASVVVVVDRLRLADFDQAWEQARSLARQGDLKAARALLKFDSTLSSEEQLLANFCRRAIDAGRSDRLEIFGFTKPDVLEYLDVSQFLPGAESWEDVLKDWRACGMEPALKDWLRGRGGNVSVPTVRKAVQLMDEVPPEFYELLEHCRRAARLLPPSPPDEATPRLR